MDLCSLAPNSPGDGDGHGTFVSSILAGNGSGHVGAAPNAKLISLDVINDEGVATTSDVIAAAQWIVDHHHKFNIRVVNLSLHAVTPSHFVNDPLDKAVEKLWFSGVVVVTAAGNYGVDGQPTAVRYAPANDPFVITVGALDSKGTLDYSDDTAAPWSTWGHTLDGFAKPEIGASGRYMIGAVANGSTLLDEFPNNVYSPGYLQLSGTSFAAPIVTGAVAQLLARHPNLTPDEVKAGLMLGSERTPAATPGSLGLGELNAGRTDILLDRRLPNPNAALNRFIVSERSDGLDPVLRRRSVDEGGSQATRTGTARPGKPSGGRQEPRRPSGGRRGLRKPSGGRPALGRPSGGHLPLGRRSGGHLPLPRTSGGCRAPGKPSGGQQPPT